MVSKSKPYSNLRLSLRTISKTPFHRPTTFKLSRSTNTQISKNKEKHILGSYQSSTLKVAKIVDDYNILMTKNPHR